MANIKEFCGYRYNPDKNINLGNVMAPPYDTVTDSEIDELYKSNEYNVIRLSKGKAFENDTDADNCYTRAAAYLNQWIKDGILVKEEKPVLYLYEQRVKYNENGRNI